VADIFISYSRPDLWRAQYVKQALTECGWSVFWDQDLQFGERYRSRIDRELKDARCVVVLWSRASVCREWVIDEAETGQRNNRLVSIRIDDVEMPLGFRQMQAATLFDWTGDREHPEFQQLRHRLRALISPDVPPPLPPPAGTIEPPRPAPESWPSRAARRHPALEPTMLLLAVFLINWIQTSLDSVLTPGSLGASGGYPIADAFRWFEGDLSFELHDTTSAVAYYGYSLAYFVVFPVLCLYAAVALSRRRDPRPYQVVSLAVAIDYAISLPFFLFFPVPERWSSPATEAMLLSDKVSDRLIELIRPVSGLDNCFPSFHVSLTVVVVAACFLFRVPLRMSALACGATIVLSTFVLGVHWIPDMIAGLAVGIVSVLLASRIVRSGRSPFLGSVTA
jgi:membrane-associated phospholipid phosphatase